MHKSDKIHAHTIMMHSVQALYCNWDCHWDCLRILGEIENWIEKARLRLREEYPDTLIYIGRGWVNPMELIIGGVVDDDDTQKFFESYFNNQTPPVPIHFKIIIQNWNIENDSLFDLFPIILCYNHTDTSCNHKKSNGEEEPKEPLCIVTEIAAIIFLVSFTDFLPFISKHGIYLTDMRLHLCGHPLVFFSKQFLNLLPVSIIDIYRHL